MRFPVSRLRDRANWIVVLAALAVAVASAGMAWAQIVPAASYFSGLSASMTTPRYEAVAAALPDGDVLIAGGDNNSSGYLSSAELFDPSTGSFSALTGSMTTPRDGAVAAALPDGGVLIAGGRKDRISSGYLSSAELFDPSTSSFSALPAS